MAMRKTATNRLTNHDGQGSTDSNGVCVAIAGEVVNRSSVLLETLKLYAN